MFAAQIMSLPRPTTARRPGDHGSLHSSTLHGASQPPLLTPHDVFRATHDAASDARTLKANLAEIRAEIDRIVIQADGGA